MNAALLGCITAFGWGSADFIARFSGRALGHVSALVALYVLSTIGMFVVVWVMDLPFTWDNAVAWHVLVTGVGTMVAMLLLYQALTRAPISVVSPIVGSYPVLSVLFASALGSVLKPQEWLAIAVVICGVMTVARYATDEPDEMHHDPAFNRRTILIALGSALSFAIIVLTGQAAAVAIGEYQTTLYARIIGVGCIVPLVIFHKTEKVSLPVRWWPLLIAQATLDTIGYISLYGAGHVENSEFAAVTASAFGAVTVLLARVVLKERMTLPQWAGIIAIFGGVAVLAS